MPFMCLLSTGEQYLSEHHANGLLHNAPHSVVCFHSLCITRWHISTEGLLHQIDLLKAHSVLFAFIGTKLFCRMINGIFLFGLFGICSELSEFSEFFFEFPELRIIICGFAGFCGF